MPSDRPSGRKTQTRGVSLIEVLIALALFALFAATLGMTGFSGVDMTREASERVRANALAAEGIDAVRAIRDGSIALLLPGTYGLSRSGGSWELSLIPETIDGYAREITILDEGAGKKHITSRVSWEFTPGRPGEITHETLLVPFSSAGFIVSADLEFDSGRHHGIVPHAAGDGAVALMNVGNWIKPKVHVSRDMPGASSVVSLAERGGTLFVGSLANGGTEFALLDISDISRATTTMIGTVDVSADVNGIALSGGYAYLATSDDSREVVVVRLSDLVIVNSVDLGGTANALTVAATGTTLFVGRSNSTQAELVKLSIADPESSLGVSGSLQVAGDVNDIVFSGGYAFLATGVNSGELTVVSEAAMTQSNTLNLSGNSDLRRLAVSGTTLYLGRANSSEPEIVAVDIALPLDPLSIIASANIGGTVRGLSASPDGRLYVASDLATTEAVVLSLLDLANIGSVDLPGSGARSVLFSGANAVIGMNAATPELHFLRGGKGEWETPTLHGGYNAGGTGDGKAVAVSGARAYLGTLANTGSTPEFMILDIANPAAPAILGSLNIGANVNDIAISGTYAYLATSDNSRELVVVSVANPAAPTIVGSYNASGNPDGLSVALSGSTLFLGTANNGSGSGREFYALNVATPASPTLIGTHEASDAVNDIALTGTHALLATANNAKEIIVLDVATPASLSESSSYDTAGTANGLSVVAENGIAYLGTENNGAGYDLYVFSLSPLGAVTLASFLDLSADERTLAIAGEHLLIGNNRSAGGFSVVNIENPGAPQIVVHSNAGAGRGIATDGIFAYLAGSPNPRELTVLAPTPISTELAREGWFTSAPFDSGSDTTSWGALGWDHAGTGTVALQFRSSATENGLSFARWVGDGGSPEAYFTATGTPIVPFTGASGLRWGQVRARLSGDGTNTPILLDISVNIE